MRAYVNNREAELHSCKCAQICPGFHHASQPSNWMPLSPFSRLDNKFMDRMKSLQTTALLSKLQEGGSSQLSRIVEFKEHHITS